MSYYGRGPSPGTFWYVLIGLLAFFSVIKVAIWG